MSTLKAPVGADYRWEFPLVTAGEQKLLQTKPAIAQGDAQIRVKGPGNSWGNAGVKLGAFTSGSQKADTSPGLEVGDTIAGATSTQTAVVVDVVLESGTWAGGDAAGDVVVKLVSGAFSAENLNVGSDLNIATIAGDFVDGQFGFDGNGQGFLWILESELASGPIVVAVIDQTGTQVWEDQTAEIELASPELGVTSVRGNPTAVSGAGVVTLPVGASATDNFYSAVLAEAGTGAKQLRYGTYNGTNREFTPNRPWAPNLATDTVVVPIAYPPGVEPIQATYLIPSSVDLANTAAVRLGLNLRSATGDLPTTAEITPGTISIERKAIGGTTWSAVVTDAAMSEAAGHVYYDEVFNAGAGYAEGDSIRVTFKSVAVVVDGLTHEIVGSGGVFFQTEVRQTMRGTDGANTAPPLDAAGVRSAIGMSLANLDTQISLLATAAALTVHDGKLDIVDGLVDTLVARLTATRAGFLDNLNVGGLIASSAEVTSVQNNTRVVRVVPSTIERPNAGTQTYRIELLLYDEAGNMEVPDSAPTIELVDQDGNDLASRLDSATMALVETGRYRAIYTASDIDELEQLVWAFSVIEGGVTRKYGNTSIIVDTVASDFTAADRTKLDTLHDTRLTAARALLLDNLDAAVSSRASAAKLLAYFQLALRADAGITVDRASEFAELNANEGSGAGSYDVATDSQEKAGTDLATVQAIVSGTQNSVTSILGDTDELQQAWADGGRLDLILDDALSRLPAATVDGLTPTQRAAVALAAHAGRIVDPAANPIVIQNHDGTQTRITATPNRASVTLSFTGA